MLGDMAGMSAACSQAATAMSQLGPSAPASGIYSMPRAEDPPYTATSLLAGRHREAAEMTRRIIATAYSPHTRVPGGQPTNYARTLLILALAAAGLGEIDEAAAAGAAALAAGHVAWPTMVLAGKLDQSLAARSPGFPHAMDFRVRYIDAGTRLALPAAPPAKGTPVNDEELTAVQVAALTADVDIHAPPPDTGPSALVLFGTNQDAPAQIAAGCRSSRYPSGTACAPCTACGPSYPRPCRCTRSGGSRPTPGLSSRVLGQFLFCGRGPVRLAGARHPGDDPAEMIEHGLVRVWLAVADDLLERRPARKAMLARDSEVRLPQGGEFTGGQPTVGFQPQEAKAGLIRK